MGIEQAINDLKVGAKEQAVPNAIININAVAPKAIPAIQTVINPPTPFDLARAIFMRLPNPYFAVTQEEPQLPTTLVTEMDRLGSSNFGTPIYANIEFQGGEWLDFDGRRREFPDMQFNEVLVTVNQQKNIIETEIQGSDSGAVLEYVGLRNYNVQCEMIVVGVNGVYPTQAVRNLKAMLTAPVPIKVNSWYLQNFDIYDLVVREFDIPQVAGGISQQPVTITFSSSNSAILVIQ
jgi:hypothetical protein